MDKKSLCWDCSNFSKCEWSKGKPIENWVAEKTTFKDCERVVNSYLVKDCPYFEKDKKVRVSISSLCDIIGETKYKITYLYKHHYKDLLKLVEEKGYKLFRYPDSHEWYISKLEDYNSKSL